MYVLISRVIFPIVFLTFHMMYWMIYLRKDLNNFKNTTSICI